MLERFAYINANTTNKVFRTVVSQYAFGYVAALLCFLVEDHEHSMFAYRFVVGSDDFFFAVWLFAYNTTAWLVSRCRMRSDNLCFSKESMISPCRRLHTYS